jgi:site-specific DNA-methyltransferase (adenine-specific)
VLNQIIHGDCLDIMPLIPKGSVDMILCDLPYGTTQNEWDSVIPLDRLWEQYKRVIKTNGAIVLTAQPPFDKVLGVSNLRMLKYEWIWEKAEATGFLNASKMPLKAHENILVFYLSQPTYTPQMTVGKPYKYKKDGISSTNYGESSGTSLIINDGSRHPRSVIQIKKERVNHPTAKPVELFRYLIETYTNAGETILDNCMGSGTTAEAALSCGRNFIGIEKELKYVESATKRLQVVQPVMNF